MDESSVEILHIVSGPDSIARNSHVDSYRYPKAGMTFLPSASIAATLHLSILKTIFHIMINLAITKSNIKFIHS